MVKNADSGISGLLTIQGNGRVITNHISPSKIINLTLNLLFDSNDKLYSFLYFSVTNFHTQKA